MCIMTNLLTTTIGTTIDGAIVQSPEVAEEMLI